MMVVVELPAATAQVRSVRREVAVAARQDAASLREPLSYPQWLLEWASFSLLVVLAMRSQLVFLC